MVEIKRVNLEDIVHVVRVHDEAFKGFFLTTLGDHFLKVYYQAVLKHEQGVLLGYYVDGKLEGFCAATKLAKGFNSSLVKKNCIRFGGVALKLLFTRPRAIVHLIKNFTKSNPDIIDDESYCELLSIGVSPMIQGTGAGKMMLRSLESVLEKEGLRKLSLTTDFFNNEKTVGFYKSQGYKKMYDFYTYPNRKMYRLIKQLH